MKTTFISVLLLSASLSLTAQTDKLTELHNECRLVRGHAHMILQMIDEDQFNISVARAHYDLVDKNLKKMEQTLSSISNEMSSVQRQHVSAELTSLLEICEETKKYSASLGEELNAEPVSTQKVRTLAARIQRSLKTAMDTQEAMRKKM